MKDSVKLLVIRLQAEMREAGKDVLSDADWESLRATIRITVEFQDYLKHGSTELARRIYEGPTTVVIDGMDPGYAARLKASSEDPWNRHDLEYACETILSGIECFQGLNPLSRVMATEVKSRIDWSAAASFESFKAQFFGFFEEFVAEPGFELKLQLLLDLFKLQIIFVGICY